MESVNELEIKKIQEYIVGIRNSIYQLRQEMSAEHSHHNEMEKVFKVRLDAIQKRCPHVSSTHYPDASGNNDSSDICNDCGAYL